MADKVVSQRYGGAGSFAPEIAALVARVNAISNPNILINGDCVVNQRNRTTGYSSSGYMADQWYMNTSGGTVTWRWTPRGDHQFVSKYYFGLNITTGNDNCNLGQRIEQPYRFAGKKLTFSCWVYVQGLTPQLKFQIYNPDTGGINKVLSTADLSSVPFSTWTYITHTFVADYESSEVDFATAQLRVLIGQNDETTTAARTVYVADMKLEEGEFATPFIADDPSIGLTRCQRYLLGWTFDVDGWTAIGQGHVESTGNSARILIPLPTSMRHNAPTVSYSSLDHFDIEPFDFTLVTLPTIAAIGSSAWAVMDSSSGNGVSFTNTGSEAKQGDSIMLGMDTAGGEFFLSAEI